MRVNDIFKLNFKSEKIGKIMSCYGLINEFSYHGIR